MFFCVNFVTITFLFVLTLVVQSNLTPGHDNNANVTLLKIWMIVRIPACFLDTRIQKICVFSWTNEDNIMSFMQLSCYVPSSLLYLVKEFSIIIVIGETYPSICLSIYLDVGMVSRPEIGIFYRRWNQFIFYLSLSCWLDTYKVMLIIWRP